MNNELGKLRQRAVIMNYGPGAIVDFRIENTGAAVSVVAAGLEEWESQAEDAGLSIEDLKSFYEPRLAEKLKKRYFRLPPVAPDSINENELLSNPRVKEVYWRNGKFNIPELVGN